MGGKLDVGGVQIDDPFGFVVGDDIFTPISGTVDFDADRTLWPLSLDVGGEPPRPMPPRTGLPKGAARFDSERLRAAEAKRARKAARNASRAALGDDANG